MADMKTPSLHLRLAGALLLAASGAALADGVAAADSKSQSTLQKLESALGDGACDSDQQCHTVAIGHKACGGPERYAAWSSKTADGKRIALLARQHAQARTAEDKRKGVMSTCSAITDPGASCQAHRCVPGNSKSPATM
jgi:hypothetical protein